MNSHAASRGICKIELGVLLALRAMKLFVVTLAALIVPDVSQRVVATGGGQRVSQIQLQDPVAVLLQHRTYLLAQGALGAGDNKGAA